MKLVIVDWIDSHSGQGWQRLSDIEQSAKPLKCRSVGWLLVDGKDAKTLVPHISGGSDLRVVPFGTGELTIPTVSILRMRTLRS